MPRLSACHAAGRTARCALWAVAWVMLAMGARDAAAVAGVDDVLAELDRYAVAAQPPAAQVEATLQEGLEAIAAEERLVPPPADSPEARDTLARLAFLRGELYRRAAAAAHGEAAAAWRDAAVDSFRQMRVTFSDRRVGLLGYVGHARVERERGELDAAAAALSPLLRLYENKAQSPGPEIYRAAVIEDLEQRLVRDPASAVAAAEAAKRSPAFTDAPALAASLDWLRARAMAVAAGRDRAKLEQAAAALRESGVVEGAPAFDRLALLAAVDERAGGGILLPDERLALGGLLTSLGHVQRAMTVVRPLVELTLAPEQRATLASIAAQCGEHEFALEGYDEALRSLPAGDARLQALRGRVAALQTIRQARSGEVQDGALRQALDELIAVEPEPALKAAALRWRVNLLAGGDSAKVITLLEPHTETLEADPSLRLALMAARWRTLAGDTHEVDAAAAARALDAEIESIEAGAHASGDDVLWCRARLERSELLASPPLRDARAALSLLDEGEARLAESAYRDAATRLELSLLLRLGLVTEAVAAWDRLPPDGQHDPDVALALATELAQRGEGAARGRVAELVNAALRQLVHDRERYVAAARSGVDALVRAGATGDAATLLDRLRSSGIELEGAQRESLASIEAQLMLDEGRPEDAAEILRLSLEASPESTELHSLLGRALVMVRDWPAAATAYRAAREHGRPGSDAWWAATLGLVHAIRESGDAAGAAKLVRAADALYRPPQDPKLLDELDQARRRLEPDAPLP